MAVSRLKCLENKFKKDPRFYENYKDPIEGYISKGYATKLIDVESKNRTQITNYIPHHDVKKQTNLKRSKKFLVQVQNAMVIKIY